MTGPWCTEWQRVGACRAGVTLELRPAGQGGVQRTGRPRSSVQHRTPRGPDPHAPLDPALLRAQAPRQDMPADSLGTPPGTEGIHPAWPPVLETTQEAARRSGLQKASGPRATTSQPGGSRNKPVPESRGAEPGWAHTRLGSPLHLEGQVAPHPRPCSARPHPAAAQDHMQDPAAGAGRGGHSFGREMGWPRGLRAGRAPHAEIGNLFRADSRSLLRAPA